MTDYIRKMSGKQYLARLKECPVVMIPTGSCEIYGPHLPMGTDLIVAKRIAELVAEKTGALIAPTIEVGESSALQAFPCTFPMPRRILEDYLDFLVGKLIQDGARNLVFLTGHAGNVDTASYVGKKHLDQHPDLKMVQIDWWRFASAHSGEIFRAEEQAVHGHAGECAASVMLYLFPELVDLEDAACAVPPPPDDWADFIKLVPFTSRTQSGAVGNDAAASREKGERLVTRCVDRIVEYLRENMMETRLR